MIDPNDMPQPIIVVPSTDSTTTSAPYAVLRAVIGETIIFQFETSDAGSASFTVYGSVDSEADVVTNNATWFKIIADTDISDFAVPYGVFVNDPPSYVKITLTPTGNHVQVKLRGIHGTQFRKVITA